MYIQTIKYVDVFVQYKYIYINYIYNLLYIIITRRRISTIKASTADADDLAVRARLRKELGDLLQALLQGSFKGFLQGILQGVYNGFYKGTLSTLLDGYYNMGAFIIRKGLL